MSFLPKNAILSNVAIGFVTLNELMDVDTHM